MQKMTPKLGEQPLFSVSECWWMQGGLKATAASQDQRLGGTEHTTSTSIFKNSIFFKSLHFYAMTPCFHTTYLQYIISLQ